MKKSSILTLLLFISTILFAQQTQPMSAAHGLDISDKTYVIGTVVLIFSSLSVFLLTLKEK